MHPSARRGRRVALTEEFQSTTQSNMGAAAKLRDKESVALAEAGFVAVEQDLWMKDDVLFGRQAALQKLGETFRK
jgi:hypothetical protein